MRKVLSIAVAVTAAATVLVPANAVASSSPAPSMAAGACAVDHFCLFENSDGSGRHGSYQKGTDDVRRQNIPVVRSASNRTNEYWCVWSEDEYMGTEAIVQPNESFRNLGGTYRSALPASAARC